MTTDRDRLRHGKPPGPWPAEAPVTTEPYVEDVVRQSPPGPQRPGLLVPPAFRPHHADTHLGHPLWRPESAAHVPGDPANSGVWPLAPSWAKQAGARRLIPLWGPVRPRITRL